MRARAATLARALALALALPLAAVAMSAAGPEARADGASDALAAARAAFEARNGEPGEAPPDDAQVRRLLDETIAKSARATELDPRNEAAWILLARARFQRAELLPPGDEDDVEELYEKGFEAGVAALRIDPRVRDESDDDEIDDALPLIEKGQAEALYWTMMNYARVVERVNVFSQAFAVGRLRRMAERLLALDDTIYHGGPARFLGAFCSEAPGMFGGDVEKSRRLFERALEVAPDFIENHYLKATSYAVKGKKDRALFRSELEKGIAIAEDALPDVAFEQRFFRKKCRTAQGNESRYFD